MGNEGQQGFEVMNGEGEKDADGNQVELYCICQQPYDSNENNIQKKMFQCEGPCQKWVHPSCFGESEEKIRMYEQNNLSYYCDFCREDPEVCDKIKEPHLQALRNRNREAFKQQIAAGQQQADSSSNNAASNVNSQGGNSPVNQN